MKSSRWKALAAAAFSTVSFVSAAHGQTFNVSWDGPLTGLYGTAANWSGNVVPNNNPGAGDFFNVTIGGGVAVASNMPFVEILNLTVAGGNLMSISDAGTFGVLGAGGGGVATVNNAGTIRLGDSAAATSVLNFGGTSNSLTGGGTIILTGANVAITGNGTVTSNNLIIGQGRLGMNTFAFINNGTVTASGGSLTIDGRASGGVSNNSLMQALAGGTLVLNGNAGGSFNNAGGQVAANGAAGNLARVQLVNGATLVGGLLVSNSFGQFFVPGSNSATLDGVSNSADVNVSTGGTLNLLGTITNNNRIRSNLASGSANFNIGTGTVTLNGSGSLVLSEGTGRGNIIGAGTLVNGSGHLIAGIGRIGNNTTTLRNDGIIEANIAGNFLAIDVKTTGTGVFNAGTIRAVNFSEIEWIDADVVNTGTITGAGGVIEMANIDLSGGTITTEANGYLRFGHFGLVPDSSLANATVINAGSMELYGDTVLHAATTTFQNSGLTEFFSTSALDVQGSIAFSGSGEIRLSGINRISGVGTFVNNGNMIRNTSGAAVIGDNSSALVNAGTISSEANGFTMTVDPSTGNLVNTGTLQARNGAVLDISGANGGSLNNSNGDVVAENATIRLVNSLSFGGGTFSSSGGTVRIPGGDTATMIGSTNNTGVFVLESAGTLVLNGVLNNSGTVDVGAGAAMSAVRTAPDSSVKGFSGNGVVNLNHATLSVVTGSSTFSNAGNTIRGTGLLGNNAVSVINSGTVSADLSGARLVVDPITLGVFTNNGGTLEARNGGILVLSGLSAVSGVDGGSFNNAGGRIQAIGASTVELADGVAVFGGTISGTTAGSRVQVPNTKTATLTNVTIDGVVNLAASTNATIALNGTIVNNSLISAGGNGVTFALGAGTTTFNGTGQLGMGLGAVGSDSSMTGTGTLVNNHLIHGHGTIGFNTLSIVNGGTIRADAPGRFLTIDAGTTFTNSGTLEASGGGVLVLSGNGGGTLLNAGTILSIGGTFTQVAFNNGMAINGGTLRSSGQGQFLVPAVTSNGSATFSNLAIAAGSDVALAATGTLLLVGTIQNDGALRTTGSTGVATYALGTGTTTLSGTGTLRLNSGAATGVIQGSGTLVNHNTITGAGTIGNNLVAIRNQSTGVMRADSPGQLLAVDSAAAFINNGTLAAQNGGILLLDGNGGGSLSQGSTGRIHALDGSKVQLKGMNISGGQIADGSGTIEIVGGTASPTSLSSMTNAGDIVMDSSDRLTLNGPIENTGRITLGANAIAILEDGTFTNSSRFVMTGGRLDGSGTVANDGLIAGFGGVQAITGRTLVIENRGEIAAETDALSLGSVGSNLPVNVNNTGLVRAASGRLTLNQDSTISGDGVFDVQSGGEIRVIGNATASETALNGLFTNVGTSSLGRVAGAGTFQSFVVGSGSPLATATHMRIGHVALANGTLRTQAGGGTLGTSKIKSFQFDLTKAKWDLNDHDLVVDYTGNSPIGDVQAAIAAGFANGTWNGPGGFTSSTAALAATTPDKTGLGYAEAGQLFASFPQIFSGQQIDSTSVLIRYTLLGDANLDGGVNIGDFALLSSNFNTTGPWNRGDFNYDGQIGIGDFSLLASNFNKTLPQARGAAVPEPATTLLLLTSTLLARRRQPGRAADGGDNFPRRSAKRKPASHFQAVGPYDRFA